MNNRIAGIYQIKNLVNGKIYIGSSVKIKDRWSQHISQLSKNKHHSKHLQSSWNKYGQSNFEFSIIEIINDLNIILEREQFYLDFYQSYDSKYGYNNSTKAGSCLGVKHNEEFGKIISERNRERWRLLSDEEKDKERLRLRSFSLKGKKSIGSGIYDRSENNKVYIFNYSQINEIKLYLKFSELYQREIAELYNSSPVTIGCISRENTWIHITIEDSVEALPEHLKTIADEIIKNRKSKNTLFISEVKEIKKMLIENMFPLDEIAKKFNISLQSIRDIKNGKTWNNIVI